MASNLVAFFLDLSVRLRFKINFRGDKYMDKTYSISDVSKIFNISTNKIRFYEKKSLLKPIRDGENEYRRFTKDDIMTLQAILLYRSIGISIKDIEDIMKNGNSQNYLCHFNNQWEMVNNEIQRLMLIRDSLGDILDKIYEKEGLDLDKDILKNIEKSNVVKDVKESWKDKWNFNNWARTYDKSVLEDKGELKIYKNYQLILSRVYNMAIEEGEKDIDILEIGVGTGNLSCKFLQDGYNIIGIDQSREMLNVAKEKHPNLKVRLGEFLKIPFNDKSFDVIVSTYAFHHLTEIEKVVAIEEMIRVLKGSGKIVIGDLMFKDKKDKEKILQMLTKEQIEEVADEYYSEIDFLKEEFEKHNKRLKYERIDRFNYIIEVI